jgi:hypothetical protein
MLNHELRDDDGILVLKPEGPLEATDFTRVARLVDAHLEQHRTLRGVLIQAKSFPGWKNFGALLAHLKFIREHHNKIDRVALVADGAFAAIMPQIASHFIHAQVRHFDIARADQAWAWLRQSDNGKMGSDA